jgi:hypothetical protein
MNRWKGAGSLLLILGAILGYMVDSLVGFVTK